MVCNAMLPPVMQTILKKWKSRTISSEGPWYVEEERKKSASLSSLSVEEYGMIRKTKSKSAMPSRRDSDGIDLEFHRNLQRHSAHATTSHHKVPAGNIFDYERILREERKEFEFRLKNIPKPTGHLNDFLIKTKLASGQFGRVYLAEDIVEKKQYAIKTISKDVILRNNLLADVEAERNYLYATNSPFIVSLTHHFEDTQRVYLVLEYISNGDIYERLKYHGPFSEELARFYVSQVVLALEYMHNVNLIYRDLKPENVMIHSNGYVKLVDFGFVKRTVKKTNTMVGTPAYLAPEIILHKPYDKSVDWWSLGVLIYEMLSGCQVTPFADSNKMAMYEKITSCRELSFPSSKKFTQSPVRDLIIRLLKANPVIRLGYGMKGSQDVKNHPWFVSIKWNNLYRRTITPPPSKTCANGSFPSARCSKSTTDMDIFQNRLRLEKLLKIE